MTATYSDRSGQGAMSALIGQRSGNRGLCAQPCRLPYRFDGGKAGYPLSLKDASLAGVHAPLASLPEKGFRLGKLPVGEQCVDGKI